MADSTAKPRRAAGGGRDVRWVVPHALAMGLCQAVMLVPLLLGPWGLGMGLSLWDEPWYTATFFAALSATMTIDDALVRCRGRKAQLAYGPAVCLVFAAGSVALTVHTTLGSPAVQAAVGCVGAVLMGFSSACAQLSSARFLATLRARWSAAVVISSTTVSACVLAFAATCRSLWGGLLFSMIPFVALLLMRAGEVPGSARATAGTGGIEVLGSVTPDGVVRAGTVAACAVAVSALVVFAARCRLVDLAVPAEDVGAPAAVGYAFALCVPVIAVMAAVCLKTRTLSMTFLYRLSLPLVMGSAVMVALVPVTAGSRGAYWLASGMASAAVLFIDQMVWVTTSYFMRFNEAFSEATASRFRALQYVGAFLGAVLAMPTVTSFGVMPMMLVGTAVLGSAFVLCIPTYEARMVSAGANEPKLGDIDAELRERHAVAFARYGLTAREAEVACLMMEGLDAPAMARELVVSRATVNTHVRHIYEKTGVHSRDEMTALFGKVPQR